MTITLRIFLIICSILAFILCIKKIKKSELKIIDSIVWVVGSIILVLMSIFSSAIEWIALKLGFLSPVSFVFFVFISILLVKTFSSDIKIAILNEKVKNLNHYIAIKENEEERGEK